MNGGRFSCATAKLWVFLEEEELEQQKKGFGMFGMEFSCEKLFTLRKGSLSRWGRWLCLFKKAIPSFDHFLNRALFSLHTVKAHRIPHRSLQSDNIPRQFFAPFLMRCSSFASTVGLKNKAQTSMQGNFAYTLARNTTYVNVQKNIIKTLKYHH